MVSYTLVVLSDSHGDREVVEAIKAHYAERVDGIFHNGDSELMSSEPLWSGIQVVGGNCDYDSGYADRLVTQLPGLTVAQTHGHLQGINFGWDRLVYLAQEAGADLCLYGHLHAAAAWQEAGIVFVNPGSVSQPRGPIQTKLYALITVSPEQIRVAFYDLNHQLQEHLTKEFNR